MFLNLVVVGGSTIAFIVGLDSWFYGHFALTPWNFYKFNVSENQSSFWGVQPSHFYLSETLPKILHLLIPVFIIGTFKYMKRCFGKRRFPSLIVSIIIQIVVHSLIDHKEDRFIISAFPLL